MSNEISGLFQQQFIPNKNILLELYGKNSLLYCDIYLMMSYSNNMNLFLVITLLHTLNT